MAFDDTTLTAAIFGDRVHPADPPTTDRGAHPAPKPQNATVRVPVLSEVVSVRASTLAPEHVTWLWPGYIPSASSSILAGRAGLGKSTLACAMAATITRGGQWPDGQRAVRGRVAYLTAEDHHTKTMVPRLMAANADLDLVEIITMVRVPDEHGEVCGRDLDLVQDVAALDRFLTRHGDARLVIVDPITAYINASKNTHRVSDVRSVMRPLEALAHTHDCTILAISHFNKAVGNHDAMTRVTGSQAWVDAVRSAFTVVADPENEDRRCFLPLKVNLSRKPDGRAYVVETASVTHRGERFETSRIRWTDEPVTFTANEALAAQASVGDDRTERDEASAWLRDALKDGPRACAAMRRQARADGLAWRTVQRRAKVLGVTMGKGDFGGEGLWSLDTSTAPVEPPTAPTAPVVPRGAVGAVDVDNSAVVGSAVHTSAATDAGESRNHDGDETEVASAE
ncbi:AAA family ATPase [Luteitalea pratensis]|uniref:AAA family ATPase n=1 Tax=Luteitalea pratensis TaxID=1855912 RepID=UPI000D7375E1|nr:AAA family ATPase [Luteitalea pratensis]